MAGKRLTIRPKTVTAAEAAALLHVSLPTLYAYVSRGLLRSHSEPGTRSKSYHRSEIEALVRAREERRTPSAAAKHALAWGLPVLESSVTLVREGALYYRGLDAVQLSRTHTFESVAALLCTGTLSRERWGISAARVPPERETGIISSMFSRLQQLAAIDPIVPSTPESSWRCARSIIQSFAQAIAPFAARQSISEAISRYWKCDVRIVEAALILSADHELNISTFVARCAASARSNMYDAACAALATFRGARHGDWTLQGRRFIDESARDGIRCTIAERINGGGALPGFGHPLYEEGDPRAAEILRLMRGHGGDRLKFVHEIVRIAHEETGERPALDFALAAFGFVAHLPPDRAFALFAAGRSSGWLAHIIEQYAQPALIRPRARYVGNEPH